MPDLTEELSQHAMKEPSVPRYFFASDGDGHTYLVPCARQAEWEAWLTAWEGYYPGSPAMPDPEPPVGMRVDSPGAWTFAFPKENRFG